jgi:endoglucanase
MKRWQILMALTVMLATAVLSAESSAAPRGNPFSRGHLYVLRPGDAGAHAVNQAVAWQHSNPASARELQKIARQPWAEWYGDWLPDPGALFRQRVATWYAPDHATAFVAVYNLPHRDCGGIFSAGGAASAGAYRAWIKNMAGAIGNYPTIVVVEPDGLPDSHCLGRGLQAERLQLLSYATRTLAALPNTSVYIDAGRSDWLPAGQTISLLRRAGVRYARGFSLDVTGYATTGAELRYGHRIGAALGGKHFIVNTSRNGNGPLPRNQDTGGVQELWCNTPGRALGPRPTTRTGNSLADAFAWVLHPGYSDGYCQGGPRAGAWWLPYATGLARRAHY